MPKIVKYNAVQIYEVSCKCCKSTLEFAEFELNKVLGINSSPDYFECPVCLNKIPKTKDMVLKPQSKLRNYKDKAIDIWNNIISTSVVGLAKLQVVTPEIQDKIKDSQKAQLATLVPLYVFISKETFDKAADLTSEEFAKVITAELIQSLDYTKELPVISMGDDSMKVELFIPLNMLHTITEVANTYNLTVNSVINALILKYLEK